MREKRSSRVMITPIDYSILSYFLCASSMVKKRKILIAGIGDGEHDGWPCKR
jgi:hypothetical protein